MKHCLAYILLPLLAFAILIAVLYTLNSGVADIRLHQLHYSLQNIERAETSIDHITLLSHYGIHKRMYDTLLSIEEADKIEFNMQVLAQQDEKKRKEQGIVLSRFHSFLLTVININRFLLNKERLSFTVDDTDSYRKLDLAFYYERNNFYQRAVTEYENALNTYQFDTVMTSSILLHLGYCHALSNNHEKARHYYQKIITQYEAENVAITATLLLQYLNGFYDEYQRLISKEDSIEKGADLYKLLAYEHALHILTKLEASATPIKRQTIRYYKARCFNGLGEKKEATKLYLEVISHDPFSLYAKLSNRRIYHMGFTMQSQALQAIALEINKTIKDETLVEMQAHTKSLNTTAKLPRNQYIKKTEREISVELSDDLKKTIASITEKSRQKEQYILGKEVSVKTVDGSLYKGRVKSASAIHIILSTSIGTITIDRPAIEALTYE